MIKNFRDISIVGFGEKLITIACDSCSGVGNLPSDIVKSDGFYTGYRTAFVPLVETLSIRAIPRIVINTLSVSMDGYGNQLIEGIKFAAKEAGMTGENVVTGSTEENFSIPVTSIGITVVGELHNELPLSLINQCHLYLVGLPLHGEDVVLRNNVILDFNSIYQLKKSSGTYDILPVGSKGISHEITEMSCTLGSYFKEDRNHGINLYESAGPATCAIVAFNVSAKFPRLEIPVIKLGSLFPR